MTSSLLILLGLAVVAFVWDMVRERPEPFSIAEQSRADMEMVEWRL